MLLVGFFAFTSVFAIPVSTDTPASNDQAQSENQKKDGEIIAMLITLNKNEVAASREALKRHVSPMVKKYAGRLQRDHSKNLQDTLNLSHKINEKPVKTADVAELKEKGQQMLVTLKPLKNQEFQVTFIDDMVKGHDEAIKKLDESLQAASNPALKAHLEKTRATVKEHLEMAQMIQNKLKSNS